MLTVSDVIRDIKAMLDEMSDTNWSVAKTIKSIKICLMLSLPGVILTTLTFWVACAISEHRECNVALLIDYFITGEATPVYMAIFAGCFQVIMLWPYVKLFLLLPYNLKKKSPLISHMKRVVLKGTVLYIAALLFTCFMAFFNPVYLFVTPVIMCLATFTASLAIDIKVTRFGIGALITELMKKVK